MINEKWKSVILSMGFSIFACMLTANDSTIHFDNSELIYRPNSQVAMLEERLYLSREKIIVEYVFENITDQDQTFDISFPVATGFASDDGDMSLPAQIYSETEQGSKTYFETYFNHQAVETTEYLRAFLNRKDVTNVFENFQLDYFDVPFYGYADYAGYEIAEEMERDGLLENGYPRWTVERHFIWKATFPARQKVRVKHIYAPSVGGYFMTRNQGADTYCMDSNFINAAFKTSPMVVGLPLTYLLGPGRNWAGPIGKLHVIIDKGEASSLVSLCANNIIKTSPTTFEYTIENYEPRDGERIDILFVDRN